MKENRSYDQIFGNLAAHGVPDAEPLDPSFTNLDLAGQPVTPFSATTTCVPDPAHQYDSVTACLAGGALTGYVKNAASTTNTDGHFVMSTYDEPQIPFYYFLARSFASNDRHFAAIAAGTFANRTFYMFGTPAGVVDTGITYAPPSTPSIFQTLLAGGYTWRAYSAGRPLSATLDWADGDPGVRTLDQFLADLDAGTLPNVSFVDGIEEVDDDHPAADLQVGEAWLKRIYDHALTSPEWPRMALVWTYDESGAMADHIAPPSSGCPGDPAHPPFAGPGPRVPFVVISPWAKRGYVSHTVQDHTAITRFIETLFDLPALGGRDANMTALFDLFDFTCGRDLSVAAAPAPGTGGCP
jgi:phospholipase C